MEVELIRKRLQGIGFTVTNLQLITDIYDVKVNTSNVLRLHKELKEIIDTKDLQGDIGDLITDMYSALDDSICFYKQKHKRKTFPSDYNIYHLLDELKMDSVTFFKEMLKDSNKEKPIKNSKSKKELLEDAKGRLINSRRIKALRNNV